MDKKIAIITGASRGIGKAVAIALAETYHVILIARSKKNLHELKLFLESKGQTADSYALNVSDYAIVKATVEDIVKRFHRIDLLFNNAGILKFGTSDIPVSDIEEMIKVNLLGIIYMGNSVANQMKKQGSGYIINVSSMAGKRALPSSGIYCASKFGVVGYTEALYKELLGYGIKVTAICPSTVDTDMTKSLPLQQDLMIQAQDISNTVKYLLNLGKNTAIPEVLVQCTEFVVQENKAITQKLLSISRID